jgi:diadenylate cyclase
VAAEGLSLLADGTPLRAALDALRASGAGALVVIGDGSAVGPLCDGGFDVGEPFSAERFVELARRDGAVVLSDPGTTILAANVHLHPDRALPTSETGIRHRTAERVARQTDAVVVALSATDGTLTVYHRDARAVLQSGVV